MSFISPRKLRRIEWRLPLGIATLLLLVVTVFSWAAYREVRASALDSAEERALDVAEQLATLLAGNLQALLDDTRENAADSTLVSGDTARIVDVLEELARSRGSVRSVELWDTLGTLTALASGPMERNSAGGEVTPEYPDWADGDSTSVSGFRSGSPSPSYAVAAPVRAAPGGEGRVAGLLVFRLALTTARESVERLEDLVGTGAAFRVGVPGGVWTDLSEEVAGPPDVIAERGLRDTYRTPDGRDVLGAGTGIAGSPWVAWVEFPRDDVLAGAQVLLSRIALLGVLVVGLGSAGGWTLSRRITTRLGDVTSAAGAIASGEESTRVPCDGDDELADLARAFNRMADEVENSRQRLEDQVRERTAELRERKEELRRHAADLEATNHELDAFCYSVSHDLRAPLRAIDGFSRSVLEEYGDSLDARGTSDLRRVCAAAGRMGRLIDDLLELSRTARIEMRSGPVGLSRIAERIVADLAERDPDRDVEVRVAAGLEAVGDEQLVELVLDNLIGNAWKFTRMREHAVIEVARSESRGAFFVRDNGAGFDMEYADKLFDPFQRLHSDSEFEGTGVGLTLVQRIIHRHGGSVWGEGSTDQGATFYFTLPGE